MKTADSYSQFRHNFFPLAFEQLSSHFDTRQFLFDETPIAANNSNPSFLLADSRMLRYYVENHCVFASACRAIALLLNSRLRETFQNVELFFVENFAKISS